MNKNGLAVDIFLDMEEVCDKITDEIRKLPLANPLVPIHIDRARVRRAAVGVIKFHKSVSVVAMKIGSRASNLRRIRALCLTCGDMWHYGHGYFPLQKRLVYSEFVPYLSCRTNSRND